MVLKNSSWIRVWSVVCALVAILALPSFAHAEDETADAFVKRLSVDVLDTIKTDKEMQSGNVRKIVALVDGKVMPHVNFTRMTASAVGRAWRQATPEQQKRLQDEFKTLLVRTYAGALSQVKDQSIAVKPLRGSAADTEVIVRTEVIGRGDPIQLDYRLEKTADGWRIYDLNVLGVWLVETYRSQLAQEITARGIDGLITALSERNKTGSGGASAKS